MNHFRKDNPTNHQTNFFEEIFPTNLIKTLIFFFQITFVYSYVLDSNLGIIWKRENENVIVEFISKSRFGYHLIFFTKEQNFTESFNFFTNKIQNMEEKQNYFIGNFTNYKETNSSSKYFSFLDKNTYPIAKSDSILRTTININITSLKQIFNSTSIFVFFGETKYKILNVKDSFNLDVSIRKKLDFENSSYNYQLIFTQFHNILQVTIPSYILEVLFYFFSFLFTILFSKLQPLKSRGIIPILASFTFFIRSFSLMIPFFPLNFYPIGCYFDLLLVLPFWNSIFVLVVISFFRYIIISNLNLRKNLIYRIKKKKNKKKLKMNLFFIFLKYITHPIITFLIWSSVIILFQILNGIFILTLNCESGLANQVYGYISIPFFTGIIFFSILLGLLDVILNLKRIFFDKLNWFKVIFKEDHFYFKFEFYILMILGSGSIYLISLILSFSGFFDYRFDLIRLLSNFFTNVIIFIGTIGFTLFLTIFFFLKNLIKKILTLKDEPMKTKFEIWLQNSDFNEIFYQFCLSELSPENFICFEDIIEFKKNPTLEKAQEMYNLYFNSLHSELEVNLSQNDLNPLKKKIEIGIEIDKTLFDLIEPQITSNLKDTYSRFIITPEYAQFMYKLESYGVSSETQF